MDLKVILQAADVNDLGEMDFKKLAVRFNEYMIFCRSVLFFCVLLFASLGKKTVFGDPGDYRGLPGYFSSPFAANQRILFIRSSSPPSTSLNAELAESLAYCKAFPLSRL